MVDGKAEWKYGMEVRGEYGTCRYVLIGARGG